jgi:hypothetical protein
MDFNCQYTFGIGASIYVDKSCSATVWDHSMIAINGARDLRVNVRQAVKDLIDRFLNDWLAANPVR